MGTVHYLYPAALLAKLSYVAEQWRGSVLVHHPDAPLPSRQWPEGTQVQSADWVAPGAAICIDEELFDAMQRVRSMQKHPSAVPAYRELESQW